MIIAKMFGGLGNQMFEYAAAKSLAVKHGTVVKLDVSDYVAGGLRNFELNQFAIDASVASIWDIASISLSEGLWHFARYYSGRFNEKACNLLNKAGVNSNCFTRYYQYNPADELPPLVVGRVASQRFFHFDSDLLSAPDGIIIMGTWASYRYFDGIRDELLGEYRLKQFSPRVKKISIMLSEKNSISVHVRRSDKLTETVHPVVPLSFYENAMQYFRNKFSDCSFFIFSDDEEWCRSNIRGSDCFYVENKSESPPAEDLWMMSRCRHNIVPTSSFSWWAAWLNDNPHKEVVIAPPSYWITLPNFDVTTVSPPEWTVIEP